MEDKDLINSLTEKVHDVFLVAKELHKKGYEVEIMYSSSFEHATYIISKKEVVLNYSSLPKKSALENGGSGSLSG